MADTGYSSTGAFYDTGIGIVRIHGNINYNVTRTNNTVYFTTTRAQIKYVRESGSWGSFTYSGWTWRLYIGTSSQRSSNNGSGTRNRDQVDNGSTTNFSVTVGANDTSLAARIGAWFSGDGQTYSNKTLSIPALGAPAGTTSIDTTTQSSIAVRNNVTTWGTNATSGSVRSYRADNSGFSGQTYISTTDNALVTHTGLVSNKEYWFRGWSDNGGGKSAYMSTVTAVTLSRSTITSKDIQSTTARFIGTAVTGKYTPSTMIQYRQVGTTLWTDSPYQPGGSFDITISSLSPSIDYEYRLVTATTAGTWYGTVTAFDTLPAAKMVMPDGSVVNAVPWIIDESGVKKMSNIKVIQP